MMFITRKHAIAFALMSLFCAGGLAEVRITRGPDGGYVVKTPTYSAVFNEKGDWTSFQIESVEMFGASLRKEDAAIVGAPWPGQTPPQQINLTDRLLAIRNESVRIEYSFESTLISIETHGAVLGLYPSHETQAFLQTKGRVAPGKGGRSLPDIQRVIVGGKAFALNQPYHYNAGSGMLTPSALTRGVKATDVFQVKIEAGVSSNPGDLVEVISFEPEEGSVKMAPAFKRGEAPVYVLALRNLGASGIDIQAAYTTSNALVSESGVVTEEVRLDSVRLAGSSENKIRIPIDVAEPGCRWVHLEIRSDGRVLQRIRRAFVYDADSFRPELTRPDDFREFWRRHLARMREKPLQPVLREVREKSTDAAVFYEVDVNAPDNTRITFDLQVPRAGGTYDAYVGFRMPGKAEQGDRILLGFSHQKWPEEAKFQQWVHEADNNLFHCYLLAVRLTDYLRSRPDVKRIHLRGGSRQGPIQLANAMLDPERIASVTAHVPTSLGISLPMTYRGWGRVPSPRSMAAYVDPLNFAPDIEVPFIIDVSLMDGLSPAPGALAFYNHASKAPWKRLGLEVGGHGYFTSGFMQAASRDLESFLKTRLDTTADDGVMREH